MKEKATCFGVQLADGSWWRGRGRYRSKVPFGLQLSLYRRREDAHRAGKAAGLGSFIVREIEIAAGPILISVVDHEKISTRAPN